MKGTKNVLSAVAKSLDSVKRVVLTSSFAGKFLRFTALTASCFNGVCGQAPNAMLDGVCIGLGLGLRLAICRDSHYVQPNELVVHHLLSNVLRACLPVLMQRAWWVTAVVNSKKGPGNGSVYTEEDWNVESSVEDEPYRYSKVWKLPVAFYVKY